jgi:hypothetical protein
MKRDDGGKRFGVLQRNPKVRVGALPVLDRVTDEAALIDAVDHHGLMNLNVEGRSLCRLVLVAQEFEVTTFEVGLASGPVGGRVDSGREVVPGGSDLFRRSEFAARFVGAG